MFPSNLRPLSLTIYVLLVIQIILSLFSMYVMTALGSVIETVETASLSSDTPSPALIEAFSLSKAAEAITGLGLFVLLICGIVFLVWMAKAHANLSRFGLEGLRFSPTWAVIGWFIPVAFLFVPFLVMREIWKASDPDYPAGRWREAPSSPLLGIWWTLWIVSGVANRLARLVGKTEAHSAISLGLIAEATWIAAGVLLFLIVREITKRQQQKAAQALPAAA